MEIIYFLNNIITNCTRPSKSRDIATIIERRKKN